MQLRDSVTSDVRAEGTPLEIATCAAEFSAKDILFDGAGSVDRSGVSLFDAAAVRKQRTEEMAGLQATLAQNPTAEVAATVRSTLQERADRIAAGKAMAADAKRLMGEARDRVARRVARGG
jgi:accessory colonization factor AcfC